VLLPTVLGLGLILTQCFLAELSRPFGVGVADKRRTRLRVIRLEPLAVPDWYPRLCSWLVVDFTVRGPPAFGTFFVAHFAKRQCRRFCEAIRLANFCFGRALFSHSRLNGLLLSLPYLFGRLLWAKFLLHEFSLMGALESFLVIGVVFLMLGHAGVVTARKVVRWPELGSVFFALLLPLAIGLLCSFLPYVIDRIRWATYDFGKIEPPRFLTYFDVSDEWNPWLLLLVFGAFAEEIIFRGLLLTHFMLLLSGCFTTYSGGLSSVWR
jgi:membrane protease YdiL (CAAX protease family)